jgi:hypothetical protein
MYDASSESRPNSAMNHGAPAATATEPGSCGSVIRSAPRSSMLRRSVAPSSRSGVRTVGLAERQALNRRAGDASSHGRSTGNVLASSCPSRIGSTTTLAAHRPRGSTWASSSRQSPVTRAPAATTRTPRRPGPSEVSAARRRPTS